MSEGRRAGSEVGRRARRRLRHPAGATHLLMDDRPRACASRTMGVMRPLGTATATLTST